MLKRKKIVKRIYKVCSQTFSNLADVEVVLVFEFDWTSDPAVFKYHRVIRKAST